MSEPCPHCSHLVASGEFTVNAITKNPSPFRVYYVENEDRAVFKTLAARGKGDAS